MAIPTEPTVFLSPRGPRSRPFMHGLIIVSVAAVLCLPLLIQGVSVEGDGPTHAPYQYHFSRQFWSGEFYPRWLMNANKGYGSPIFLMQYPLPYWITALLRPITRFRPTPAREARELGVFCFLALAAAGLAARFWLQKRHIPFAATAAAIVYISCPYVLAVSVYLTRIGQLLAFVLMPLALAACDSCRLRFRAVSALGIVLVLLVLSNLFTALLFVPLMVGYAVACRESNHMSLAKCIVSILLSFAIAACLAAIYLFPLVAYRHLFDTNALPLHLPGEEFSHRFSFVRLTGLNPHIVLALVGALVVAVIAARSSWRAGGSMALRVGMLLTLGLGVLMIVPELGPKLIGLSGLKASAFEALKELTSTTHGPEKLLALGLSTAALGVFSYCHVSENGARRRDYILLVLVVTVCGAFMLMLPVSALVWKAIPGVATAIGGPNRLGPSFTIAAIGLFAAAIDSCWRRKAIRSARLVAFMAIAVIADGAFAYQAGWIWNQLSNPSIANVDETRDVDPMFLTYVSPDHLAAFAKLIGAELNNYNVQQTPVDQGVAYLVRGRGVVNVMRQSPRKLLVSYTIFGEGRARIGQLYSPLWRIEPTSESSGGPSLGSSAEGLIEVSLVPGRHDLELVFDGGWPERYGMIVTFVSIAVFASGLVLSTRWPRKPKGVQIGELPEQATRV